MSNTINDNQSTEDGGAVGKPAVVPSASFRIKCKVCGWITSGRVPRGGDGSLRYPRLHRVDGQVCGGRMVFDGEWL